MQPRPARKGSKRERERVVRAHEFLLQQVQIAAIRRGLSDMRVALYPKLEPV